MVLDRPGRDGLLRKCRQPGGPVATVTQPIKAAGMVNWRSTRAARVEHGSIRVLFSQRRRVAKGLKEMEMEKEARQSVLAPRKSGFVWHPSAEEPCHNSIRNPRARIADSEASEDRISPAAACTPSKIPQPSSGAWAAAVEGPKTSVAAESFIWAAEQSSMGEEYASSHGESACSGFGQKSGF